MRGDIGRVEHLNGRNGRTGEAGTASSGRRRQVGALFQLP
jgi:hypothetical protein